mmetsp:Transcript_38007/g.92109  ORF Transcript_38007/g.92109 Transcript_38007/m.92109 type:complete len:213 (+) Transcript_38007:173-811(+)
MGSEEFECTAGSIPSKTQCILTYGGSERDIIINYALVAINLFICIKALVIHNNSVLDKFYRHATWALAFVVLFQIVLCLILGCSGISIIWCSMAGWIMSQRRQMIRSGVDEDNNGDSLSQENRTAASSITHEKLSKMGQWAILLDLGAIVYYLVVSEFIATVAHGCALVMGACLSELANKHSGVTTRTTTETSTSGTNEEPLLDDSNNNQES